VHSIRSSAHREISTMSAAELKRELLNSLISMQSHTVMVQDGILHVQDIAPIHKPQAKTVVRVMAAERMRDVLGKILRRELQKGFNAWTMDYRAQIRDKLLNKAKSFLHLRMLGFLIRRWLLKILSRKFLPLKNMYMHEKEREKNIKRIFAVVSIQRRARGMLARARVEKLKDIGKYRAMYDATVKIQSIIRGRVVYWRYRRARRKKLEDRSCRLLQRVYRGYRARCRVYERKLLIFKRLGATKIQCMVRSKIARTRVAILREQKRIVRLVTKIQSVVRMHIQRKNVAKIADMMYKTRLIVYIQKRVRGKKFSKPKYQSFFFNS